ncbi:MAG: DUF1934 domain-containing protein [Clostridia bacterium]|nr:DUF1934 domain-containing protein [Clostridia bacterium]
MNVWITLNNHIVFDGETDEVGVELQGELTRVADSVVLKYDEVGEGGEVTHVQITVSDDRVSIKRIGTVSSMMILQNGIRHSCLFRTPAGILNMDALLLEADKQEDGDTVIWNWHYSLYVGPGEPADHHMTVTVRPIQ